MAVILSVGDSAPGTPAADARGYRLDPPPRSEPRRTAKVGAKFVDYLGADPPTQAELDAFLTSDAAAQAAAAKVATLDGAVSGFSFGGQTLATLKAMDSATFDAWWAVNITSFAQANVVLRMLAKAALHRML